MSKTLRAIFRPLELFLDKVISLSEGCLNTRLCLSSAYWTMCVIIALNSTTGDVLGRDRLVSVIFIPVKINRLKPIQLEYKQMFEMNYIGKMIKPKERSKIIKFLINLIVLPTRQNKVVSPFQ